MTDQRFEARLDELFAAYAQRGVRPIDRHAIARATIASAPQRPSLVWRARPIGWSWRLVAVALLVAAAIGTAMLVGSRLLQTPLLATPSPNSTTRPTPPVQATPTSGQPAELGVPAAIGETGTIVVYGSGGFVSIAPDGERTVLPISGHSRSCPTFSPDGRWLSFLAGELGSSLGHLSVADAAGTNVRNLWTGEFDDQTFHQVLWSPNAAWVLATRAVDPAGGTVVANVAAGSASVLDWNMGESSGLFAWSPDGQRLAAIYFDGTETQAIQVRDVPDGSASNILTARGIGSIAWSGDGTTLAYAVADAQDSSGSLHLVQPDGANDRVVARTRPGAMRFAHLAWSPDGSRLVALEMTPDATTSSGLSFAVELFDPQGTLVKSLGTFPAVSNLDLTWAPDSRALLLSTGGLREDVDHPLIVPIDGRQPIALDVKDGYYTQCPLAWGATPG